jgi:hypothetical protein
MNEMTIKKRIEDAVGIQSAPEKLVKQTVLRVQGIVAGRSAEQRLEQEGERLPKEEVAYLTAAGLIGRLAISGPLPEGSSLQQMTEQLAASPKLNQRLNRPVEETLSRLRSGMLLKELGAQAPEREKPPAEKPMEMAPPVM